VRVPSGRLLPGIQTRIPLSIRGEKGRFPWCHPG
jgi:hypothetical protein